MKVIIIFAILALSAGALAAPKPKPRGTPEEFLNAAVVATAGIRSALEVAATAIDSALVGDAQLQGVVGAILDTSYDAAADLLGPALEALQAATTDEGAEAIVVDTISKLMIIALDAEFKVQDAMTSANENLQIEVQVIMNALVTDLKSLIKPLWDLTQDSRH